VINGGEGEAEDVGNMEFRTEHGTTMVWQF
jgi:hypothetical protein